MEVKDAVNLARDYVHDLFADEQISNLGLDEVEYDESKDVWLVTVGFSRPWDYPKGALAMMAQSVSPRRSYKQVAVKSGKVVSVKNRYAEK